MTRDAAAAAALEAASEGVKAIVRSAAEAVGRDLAWQEHDGDGEVAPCVDAEGAPTGLVYVHHSLQAVPSTLSDWEKVLQDVAAVWAEQGLDVRRRDYDDSYTALFVSAKGYDAKVAVNRAEGRVVIGASTPCLPDPETTA